MIVSSTIQADRITICKGCKYYKPLTRSCGTLLIGGSVDEADVIKANKVTHYKRKVRLCGCVMTVKTKYTWASCPIGKWGTVGVSKDELVQVKKLLVKYEGKTSFDYHEIKPLFTAMSKISGKNIAPTTCGNCVAQMLEDLRKATQDIEIE